MEHRAKKRNHGPSSDKARGKGVSVKISTETLVAFIFRKINKLSSMNRTLEIVIKR